MVDLRRFDICLISLDPTIGAEIKKTRPCVIISPNEMNYSIKTVIIAPMTTKGRKYPSRLDLHFEGKPGQIVLDQIRTVDKERIVKKLGTLSHSTSLKVAGMLVKIFSY